MNGLYGMTHSAHSTSEDNYSLPKTLRKTNDLFDPLCLIVLPSERFKKLYVLQCSSTYSCNRRSEVVLLKGLSSIRLKDVKCIWVKKFSKEICCLSGELGWHVVYGAHQHTRTLEAAAQKHNPDNKLNLIFNNNKGQVVGHI